MKSRMFLAALLLCSVVPTVGTMQSGGCVPDGNVKFICGVVSPEDLVAVPRSNWVIASGFAGGAVHLINTRDYSTTQVYPASSPRERFDKKTYASCPGPIDPAEKAKFSAHGLAVAPGAERVHSVYLVHHGFRESIEIFEIDTRPTTPTFTWIGCVVAPPSAGLNSVSPLPGGGFAATSPNRRGVPAPSPDNTGEVWEWNAKEGWKIIPGSESQGPNGIEVSRDGKVLYVNLWPAKKVMRLSRGQTKVVKDFVDVTFNPDNIRWQADGSLLAAGHGGPNAQRVVECLRKVCTDTASVVARIDPKTFKAQEIIRYPASERFRNSTVALQVGKEIWIGTISDDRIARYPVP
jgi:sugar lactone lactonase YvrE